VERTKALLPGTWCRPARPRATVTTVTISTGWPAGNTPVRY